MWLNTFLSLPVIREWKKEVGKKRKQTKKKDEFHKNFNLPFVNPEKKGIY